jgi:hypothetical protein
VKLLNNALWNSRWERTDDDHSAIWRPAIGDHVQNHNSQDPTNALVTNIRDAVLSLASSDPALFESWVDRFLQGSTLYRRIALHALSATGEAPDLASRLASDRSVLDDYRLTHEIAELLGTRWDEFDGAAQESVLSWIEEGDEGFADQFERFDGRRPTEQEIQDHSDRRRRDRYSYIARHLDGANQMRYQALVESFGEADHADFLSWTESGFGTTGPLEPAHLTAMSLDELLEFLVDWTPPPSRGWPPAPTIEGLAHDLQSVAVTRAAELAANARRLSEIDPTYLSAVFSAFETALKDGVALDWEPLLDLALSVANKPFEPDGVEPRQGDDPTDRWTRRQVIRTLEAGMAADLIPRALAPSVWSVIERLTHDPNPSPAHEARFGGDNMDPFTLSLNANRSTAIHAVVEYGLWRHRHLVATGTEHPNATEHFPEILATLDWHLFPDNDPSAAVRSTYGRWYPWLQLLDQDWTAAHREAIFGPADDPGELGIVAWDSYIIWSKPYDKAFESLTSWYQQAIERLPPDGDGSESHRSPHQKLGEHLSTFLWRGIDRGLAGEFFRHASDRLAGTTVGFIGRTLSNTAALPDELRQRIQTHWDRRIETIRSDPEAHQLELREFATWVTSAQLDPNWALDRLEEALQLSGAPSHSTALLEMLAGETVEPATAMRLLALVIRGTHDPWEHVLWREPARAIVARARDSSELRGDIRDVVDYFVQTGDLTFRELSP